MKILLYNRLNTEPVQRQFDKTLNYLQQGDFRSADVRKMKTQGFYRARLDDTNRLLFQIGKYEGEKYLFILEVILNHDYDKSRFLRGAAVKEEKLRPIYALNAVPDDEVHNISYLNPNSRRFTILDKFITFDERQSDILQHEAPMLLLGAAGCGKTVLALEKMRQAQGGILYITLSPYLVEKAQEVYENCLEPIEGQTMVFFSLDQYLQQIAQPKGKEATYEHFKAWFDRISPTVRIRDTRKLFEEIRGVLTGTAPDKPYLSKEDYLQLGIRQSVFSNGDREQVYDIFRRYLSWLKSEDLYDPNIAAQVAHQHVMPLFDLVVVDEVQDMTNVQLSLLLKSLRRPDQFILCGDANQVVHPNFFSWTSIKRLLHQRGLSREVVRLLPGNHRNDENIIKISNRVLALKNVRFGSIDRESSTLIDTMELTEGDEDAVQFFEATESVLRHLDKAASSSSLMAIIVLREEDKAAAKKQFQTPLVFTVHEVKGLEFSFVVLYNFITDSSEEFASICEGVAPRDLNGQLQYSRPKDKEDRSLQAYLFYINSLYVATTRAANHLYVVESNTKHRLFSLLGVRNLKKRVGKWAPMPPSSLADWQREAERLEKFGNKEQAEAIKAKFGNTVTPPWSVMTYQDFMEIRQKYMLMLADKSLRPCFNVREQAKMTNYLMFYPDLVGIILLLGHNKGRVMQILRDSGVFLKKLLMPYQADNIQRIEPIIKKYGPNHLNELGLTPLMLATMAGAPNIAKYLLMAGADPSVTDNWGRTAFQLAIVRAYKNERYAKEKFKMMADIVHPPFFITKDSEHSYAVPYGTLAYYISSIILALQLEFYILKREEGHAGFRVDDFRKILQHLVTDEQSAKKFKKEYLAAYLAKSDVRLNKNPFLIRLRKGYYTHLLHFEVKICDEWVMLQDLFDIFHLQLLEAEPAVNALRLDLLEWAHGMKAHFEQKVEEQLMEEDEAYASSLPDEGLRDWPA